MIKTPEFEADRAAAAKWEKTRRAKERYAAERENSKANRDMDTEASEPATITSPPTDLSGVI